MPNGRAFRFGRVLLAIATLLAATQPLSATSCDLTAPSNSCSPGGGSSASDCAAEWLMTPEPGRDGKGVPKSRTLCFEGDPRCDFDSDPTRCTFRLELCVNNSDPRLPLCHPAFVEYLQVKSPRSSSSDETDLANRAALEGLTRCGDGLCLPLLRDGLMVSDDDGTNQPNGTANLCSAPIEIQVPLRNRAGVFTKARRSFSVVVKGGSRPDVDALKFECLPGTCGNGNVESAREQCDDANRGGGDGCDANCLIEIPTETPTETPTITPTPSTTATPSDTPTASPSATRSPSPSPSLSRTNTRTPTFTPTATRTATFTATATRTSTRTVTPSPSPTFSHSPTETELPTATETDTPTPSETPTMVPTETPSPTDTATPSPSDTPSPSETATSEPTATATETPTDTATASPTYTGTATRTPTPLPTATFTATRTPSHTVTRTPTATATPTTAQPCNPDGESYAEPTFHRELAYRWAPIIIHDTASKWNADLIGRVDYDGDWRTNNNWDNLPSAGIAPYLYYNVIETSTHWFIHYHTYHPRDWDNVFFGTCAPGTSDCHENDSENVMVMVQKDGSTYGRFRLLQTRAHTDFYQYAFANDGVSNGVGSGAEDLDNDSDRGFNLFTDASVGVNEPRPALYVESKGHGMCDWWDNDGPYCTHSDDTVPGDDGVMYYPSATANPVPPANPEGGQWFNFKSPYRLLSLWDDVWVLRSCLGDTKTFDIAFSYSGVAGNGGSVIGKAFDGDDYADDAATSWWAQSDGNNDLPAGDWTFDPAGTVVRQLTFSEPVDTNYQTNFFLGIE